MKFGPDVEWIDTENYEVDASARAVVLQIRPQILAGAAG